MVGCVNLEDEVPQGSSIVVSSVDQLFLGGRQTPLTGDKLLSDSSSGEGQVLHL